MPRGKKKEETFTKDHVKDTLMTARTFTQDQVRSALAEICNRENVDQQTAKRIASIVDIVVNQSFSKIMSSSGM